MMLYENHAGNKDRNNETRARVARAHVTPSNQNPFFIGRFDCLLLRRPLFSNLRVQLVGP